MDNRYRMIPEEAIGWASQGLHEFKLYAEGDMMQSEIECVGG